MRRYANRRDANEPEIVEALRKVGASVMQLNEFDLLVGFRGNDYKIEIKAAKGKLTDSQKKFDEWNGSPLYICRTIDEAMGVILKRTT